MWKSAIPSHACIALCDGTRGLILHNDGNAGRLQLRAVATYAPPAAPGRRASSNPRRADTGNATLPNLRTVEFLSRFLLFVDRHASKWPQSGLVIVAPPELLDLMRQMCAPTIRQRIVAEIPRDVSLPTVEEIKAGLVAHSRRRLRATGRQHDAAVSRPHAQDVQE